MSAMKTADTVTAEKLRGGFYSPPGLVDRCLDRIAELVERRTDLAVLEPSAGDGAFLRGLTDHALAPSVAKVVAIEINQRAASFCRSVLHGFPVASRVIAGSAIAWAASTDDQFDVAVGNPPFVRFQFVEEADKADLDRLGSRLETSFGGVSNLWIPVLMGALSRVRAGGAFAFIVPTECLTGVSAGVVRRWLGGWVDQLRLDLFAPGSFPGVLQEVLIVSGQVRVQERWGVARVEVVDHSRVLAPRRSQCLVPVGQQTWTRYLLDPSQLDAIKYAQSLEKVKALGDVARFQVAAVTGANDFFSVDRATVDLYGLQPWIKPLLPRIRHARGLRYTLADHASTEAEGAKAWLLYLTTEIGAEEARLHRYLRLGESQGIASRYKCRIRSPWYAVPHVWSAPLLLSKRCHRHPRLVLNEASVVTTDTIYRGVINAGFAGREHDVGACFHNSLTLLTAEIEGRSFGGGVLEVVPSEIRRLSLPLIDDFGANLPQLDDLARGLSETTLADDDQLVEETDRLLIESRVGFTEDLILALREARSLLLGRRLDRNSTPGTSSTVEKDHDQELAKVGLQVASRLRVGDGEMERTIA
jgi:hypothetical protein